MWAERATRSLLAALSEREQQVAALVCEGHSNRVIAEKLNVSEGTVKGHLHRIFYKLRIQSRLALIDAFARAKSD